MNIRIVLALGKNREIGVRGKLPWNLPADLAHFRRTTLGKPVIMGRETFASIGHPLPQRTNIVLTRNLDYKASGVLIAHSFSEALELAARENPEEICVIGGGKIVALALPEATHLSLTFVAAEFPEADAFFPAVDWSQWREVSREEHQKDAENPYDFAFVEFERSSSRQSAIGSQS